MAQVEEIIPVLCGWAEHNIREEAEESVAVLGWYASTGKFETLTEDEDTDNLFERAVSALDKVFEFVANKRFERYKLRQMSQRTGETVSQFSTRLLGQGKYCDYGTDMEDHVCDQLLIGISNNRLRKKLLEVDDLT